MNEIQKIKDKFLDFSKRDRNDHPAKAISPDEREIYARYLDAKGQPKGAASFRNYVEPPPAEPKKKRDNRRRD